MNPLIGILFQLIVVIAVDFFTFSFQIPSLPIFCICETADLLKDYGLWWHFP